MYSFSLLNHFAVIISLLTATGVTLHDTKLDRAFVSTINTPIISRSVVSSAESIKSTELHTHVERTSFAQAVHNIQSGSPRIHPREDHKKHVTPKSVSRGHHAFDNYSLPMVV